jgi:predicted CopG family antitoxin
MHLTSMATTTIGITSEAQEPLKQLRSPGETFSDVVVEHFSRRRSSCEAAGQLLDRLESLPPPQINKKALNALRGGRGRRSTRRVK